MKLPIIKSENEVTNTVLAIGFDMERHRDKLLTKVFDRICEAAYVNEQGLTHDKETGEVFINLEMVGIYFMNIDGGKTVINFIPVKCYRDESVISNELVNALANNITQNYINNVRYEILNGTDGDNPKNYIKLNHESIINKLKNEK